MQLLFSLVIMFLSSNCSAQFVEVSHREGFNSQFNEFVRGSNGELVLGEYYRQGSVATIYRTNSDSLIWKDEYYNVVWHASINTEGDLILFLSSEGCDVTGSERLRRFEIAADGQVVSNLVYQYIVYGDWGYGAYEGAQDIYFFGPHCLKIDSEGNLEFQTSVPVGQGRFTTVLETSDHRLFGFTSSGLVTKFDFQGEITDPFSIGYEVRKAVETPFGDFILITEDQVLRLDTANNSVTNVSASLGMAGSVRDFIVDSSGVVILNSGGVVTRIDTSWSIVAQSNLSAALNVQELWSTDSGIYCSGFAGEAGYILRLAEDLSIVSDIQLNWMTVNDLNVFDGMVHVIGTESYNPHHQAPSALYKTFTTDLVTAPPAHDVSMVGISVDSISSSNYSTVNYTYQYPSVRILNEGTYPLETVYLSYHNEPIGSGICEWQELRYEVNGLGLGVGEDTVIQLPPIPYVSYSSISGPTELTLCAYAYSPNRKVDVNRANNKTCTVFSVNVSVAETEQDGLWVYPNPFQNELIIELNDPKLGTELIVRDILGRQVFSQPNINGNRSVIQTSNWPDGIYLLTIESEHGSVIWKVVKR